ncbi:hypothetical protein HMPREF9156_00674 [Scardovia wiggsiae F0424]|uniref:Uncharacterized protein n=1 Tax=Scardovia wiggsiae F0424 TaxID=857290 RepID=J0D5H4_9BIFI|nr:hypothetical protein HMPREF9156_00674 [Scardovia wiggsiae F0424]
MDFDKNSNNNTYVIHVYYNSIAIVMQSWYTHLYVHTTDTTEQ